MIDAEVNDARPLKTHAPLWFKALTAGPIALPLVALIIVTAHPTVGLFDEGGPIELASGTLWMLLAIAGVMMCWRGPTNRDRLVAVWLTVLAVLACLRECDAHTLLNPQGPLGDWGVRYKINWWLSGSAPVLPRIAWGLIGIVVAGLLVMPPFLIRVPAWRLVKARDKALLAGVLAGMLLFAGYMLDDQIGRGRLISPRSSTMMEEAAELIGTALFGVCLILLHHSPFSERFSRIGGGDGGSAVND